MIGASGCTIDSVRLYCYEKLLYLGWEFIEEKVRKHAFYQEKSKIQEKNDIYQKQGRKHDSDQEKEKLPRSRPKKRK